MSDIALYKRHWREKYLKQIDFESIKQSDYMGPRLIEDEDEEELIDTNILSVILDLFKCPICLDIYD